MAYVYAAHTPLVWSPAYTHTKWGWTCNCGKVDVNFASRGEANESATEHAGRG